MGEWLPLDIAGEPMRLSGERALYWPARRRLLIADLHLGKADVFRRAGIGVPRGGTTHDLDRLSRLLAATRARELWVLGDMLHGAAPRAPWLESWDAWRARHAGVRIGVVSGNHDRALAAAGLGIDLLGEVVDDDGFRFRHAPPAGARGSPHVVCGHLHPVVRLPGVRGRWPCYWLQPGACVLPAFSAFTGGGQPLQWSAVDRVVACVDGAAVGIAGWPRVQAQ